MRTFSSPAICNGTRLAASTSTCGQSWRISARTTRQADAACSHSSRTRRARRSRSARTSPVRVGLTGPNTLTAAATAAQTSSGSIAASSGTQYTERGVPSRGADRTALANSMLANSMARRVFPAPPDPAQGDRSMPVEEVLDGSDLAFSADETGQVGREAIGEMALLCGHRDTPTRRNGRLVRGQRPASRLSAHSRPLTEPGTMLNVSVPMFRSGPRTSDGSGPCPTRGRPATPAAHPPKPTTAEHLPRRPGCRPFSVRRGFPVP